MNKSRTTEHDHQHSRNHRQVSAWKRLHRDWRTWAALILMLVAMLFYVLSDDESLQPGGGSPDGPMPAATGI